MKPIIMELDKMSDSQEMYEAKPKRAGIIFIYVIFAMLVAVICWMVFSNLEEVVKTQAVIRPQGEMSTVLNQAEGKVAKVNVVDGMSVKKGDCLYTIDCQSQVDQKEYLDQKIQELKDRKKYLALYKKSVEKGINYFDKTGEEENYYVKFNAYYTGYQNAIKSSKYENEVTANKMESYQKQLSKKQNALKAYDKVKQSVKEKKNLLKDSGEEAACFHLYEKYVNGCEKIKEQYRVQEEEIKAASVNVKNTRKKQLLRNNTRQKENELKSYRSDFESSLESAIAETKDAVDVLEDNISALKLEVSKNAQEKGAANDTSRSLKLNEIRTAMDDITACKAQLDDLKSQLVNVQFQLDHGKVCASVDGVVNESVELVEGDVLPAGTKVMTIVPKDGEGYKANIYASNHEIGKLREGMEVKFQLDAFPSSEYGSLKGTITSISSDIKAQNENGYGFYLVEASVEPAQFIKHNGDHVQLKAGMSGQAKIVVGEKSIFRYVMEKLSLWLKK